MVKEEKGLLLEFAVQQRSKGRNKWHLGLLSLTKASLLSCGNTADGCIDVFVFKNGLERNGLVFK